MREDVVKLSIEDLFEQLTDNKNYRLLNFETSGSSPDPIDNLLKMTWDKLLNINYERIVLGHLVYNITPPLEKLNLLLSELESFSKTNIRYLADCRGVMPEYPKKPITWGATHNSDAENYILTLFIEG
ncbi:MAG: hypothetical protein A2X18_07250 [Bacteroidetes bacterium GWF2_40_14]|nr:MAG: hypothetical protein A2X18_07250 [Bacteroidetes bacterium GWF2_40_14]